MVYYDFHSLAYHAGAAKKIHALKKDVNGKHAESKLHFYSKTQKLSMHPFLTFQYLRMNHTHFFSF